MVSWTCCLYLSIFINLLQEMILSSILSWLCSFSIPSQWLKLREYLPFSKNWFIISTRGWETTLCLLSDSSSKSLKEDENVAVNNSAPLDFFGWDCPSPDEEGYELHGSRSSTKDKMHEVAAESVILARETFSYFLRLYFYYFVISCFMCCKLMFFYAKCINFIKIKLLFESWGFCFC